MREKGKGRCTGTSGEGDTQTGAKERGTLRSDGAKWRRTVLGTFCLRLKIGPVVTVMTGVVMRSQQAEQ